MVWLPPAQLISPFMSCQECPKEAGFVVTLEVMYFCSETQKKTLLLQHSYKKYVRLHICPTGKFL